MDRFDAMRAFVRVVDTRGFTKAAEALNLNTGTVSRMVQILEEQTNVRLLNRTTRSVSPTPEGQTYYEACVRVLEQVDSMNEEAMSAAQSPEGRIKVGMPAIFARGLVIPALPSLLDAYPGLDIELAYRMSSSVSPRRPWTAPSGLDPSANRVWWRKRLRECLMHCARHRLT
ncbi:LysR substrate binding domain-containing protein [Paraburkholderia tropica]|uniref:LysR substrate binding domain-containing protein n=1 Tax=Paraburkholderia tropica TaxID=92647 RepID=A0AAQ1GPQ0_9BURK|nr:LysR family transcriptional regulator [Paraburkholderia tropica]SEK15728.1 LysR substrate binding domain-containing protein [Paraburkholderia tropica]